jgi:predicted DNA-binding transcriptional regulator YafY
MPPTKTQRWLDLIAFLVGRKFLVTAEEIMEGVPGYLERGSEPHDRAWESARRKFERDKDELRALGIPIESDRYKAISSPDELEGYLLRSADFYLPYLEMVQRGARRPSGTGRPARLAGSPHAVQLELGELAPAITGLRRVAELPSSPLAREARSALRKLTFDLDAAALPSSPVLFAVPREEKALTAPLQRLLDALLRRKKVSFVYRGMYRDDVSNRTVHPYGLLYQHAHWYLIGHDETRESLRVFRVGRLSDVEVNARRPNSSDYEVPPAFDMGAYADREAWTLGADDAAAIEARVRFTFPRSLWAERNQLGDLIEEDDKGTTTRAFRVQQPEPFVRWILSLEGDAWVESPPELRALFDETVREVAALYGVRPRRG